MDPFTNDFDLAAFRVASANYLRLLIRARAKSDRTFLTQDDYKRWSVHHLVDRDRYSVAQLLKQAYHAIQAMDGRFLSLCPSGGVACYEDDDPHRELKENLAEIANTVLAFPEWIRQAKAGEEIDWDSLGCWHLLPQLRDALDQFPLPESTVHHEEEMLPAAPTAKPRKGRRRARNVPVTERQLKIYQSWQDNHHDSSETAEKLGISRQRVQKVVSVVDKKLCLTVSKPKRRPLPTDHRGQVNVSEDDLE